jgi:hypothetical protein
VGREQVASADTFWISTVRPDGRPHVTPLIAVWHNVAAWFTTGPEERKARNLSHNAACILTTGRSELSEGGLDVVLEGAARPSRSPTTPRCGLWALRGIIADPFVRHGMEHGQSIAIGGTTRTFVPGLVRSSVRCDSTTCLHCHTCHSVTRRR